ncbi:MAG: restriction endonuclease subunit S [Acidobacteria bacterium]|nr:restriction endonuclease subunit S [Acidobacteriota bacterium]
MSDSPEWRRMTLRDVTLKTQTWNPFSELRETVRYVDVSAVSRETLEISSVAEIPGATAPSRARKIIESGDTIFATIRPRLKRVAQVPNSLHGEIASTAFCVLRPNRDVVDPEFLFFATCNDAFVDEVASLETGASYPAVRDSDVLDREILLPTLPEQRQIAYLLSAVRSGLLHQSTSLTVAENLKRAAMREIFTRGLRGEPHKETEFGPIPEGWEIDLLDHVAKVQTGAAKGRKFADAEVVEVPYLRVANVQDGHLDLSEMKMIQIRRSEIQRYRLQVGDVVLTEGGDFDKLGRGFIWRGQIELCVHQNHVFAVRLSRNKVLPEFFAYLAQSPYGKAYFLKVAHKTTNLACINTVKLKSFPVIFPSLDEQQEIVTILDAINRKIAMHQQKRAVLEELFKSLLHKLMTGEIRVADLDLSALEAQTAQTV